MTAYNKYTKKRMYPKNTKSVASTASTALRIAKKVNKIVGTREMKFQDTAIVSTVPTYTGTIVNLIAPVQGVNDSQRIGSRINVEKIEMRMAAGQTGVGSTILRFILVRDKSNAMTANAVLTQAYQTTVNYPFSPYNEDYVDQFEILADWSAPIDNITKTYFRKNVIKRINKEMRLAGTGTAVDAGQIKLFYCSAAAAPAAAFNAYIRIWFTDL